MAAGFRRDALIPGKTLNSSAIHSILYGFSVLASVIQQTRWSVHCALDGKKSSGASDKLTIRRTRFANARRGVTGGETSFGFRASSALRIRSSSKLLRFCIASYIAEQGVVCREHFSFPQTLLVRHSIANISTIIGQPPEHIPILQARLYLATTAGSSIGTHHPTSDHTV